MSLWQSRAAGQYASTVRASSCSMRCSLWAQGPCQQMSHPAPWVLAYRPDETAGGTSPRDEVELVSACHKEEKKSRRQDAKAARDLEKQVRREHAQPFACTKTRSPSDALATARLPSVFQLFRGALQARHAEQQARRAEQVKHATEEALRMAQYDKGGFFVKGRSPTSPLVASPATPQTPQSPASPHSHQARTPASLLASVAAVVDPAGCTCSQSCCALPEALYLDTSTLKPLVAASLSGNAHVSWHG